MMKKKIENLLQRLHDQNLIVKTIVIITLLFIAVFSSLILFLYFNAWISALLLLVALLLVILLILVKKLRIYTYILPAAFLLLLFSGFPIVYTVMISFSNFKVGHIISHDDALKNLLTSQWHVDKRHKPFYAEVYAPGSIVAQYSELYEKRVSPLDDQLDAIIDADLSERIEDIVWDRRDRVELSIIRNTFEQSVLEDMVIILYSESHIAANISEKKKKRVVVYSYIPGVDAAGDTLKCHKTSLSKINSLIGDRICIGDLIYERPSVEQFDRIELTLLPHFAERLRATGENEYDPLPLEFPNGTIYRLDYGTRFLVKLPFYRRVDGRGNILEKMVVNDDGTYHYGRIIQADNYLGSYVTTKNDETPRHWQEYRIKTPDYIVFPWFWWAYHKSHAIAYLDTNRSRTGLNQKIRECFPANIKDIITGRPIDDVSKIEIRQLQHSIKKANKVIRDFNKTRYGKNGIKQYFVSGFGEWGLGFPKLGQIKLVKIDKSNVKRSLAPGYRVFTGIRGYKKIVLSRKMTESFFRLLIWTVIFATLTVALSFMAGLGLASILNKPGLHAKNFYRSIFILPYAIPAALLIMMWAAFLNKDFGVINNLINLDIPWISNIYLSKMSAVVINIWLSFPYFMIICLGSLQSINPELYDVSSVDGASSSQQFWRITLPLVLRNTAPLLIGYFGFTFNNFTLIYLLPGKGTGILVTFIYSLAFYGKEYGLAASLGVITFFVIGPFLALQFVLSGVLKGEVLRE